MPLHQTGNTGTEGIERADAEDQRHVTGTDS